MTFVAIDFGTSRTAFAFFTGDEHAMTTPRALQFRFPKKKKGSTEDPLGGYLDGLEVLREGLPALGVGSVPAGGDQYYCLFSQYAQLGPAGGRVVLPYSADRSPDKWDRLDGHIELVPAPEQTGAFESVKQSPRHFAPLLRELIKKTCPWDELPATWIVGWSAGIRDTPDKLLGIPNAVSYNEAVAVAFQLAFSHADPALRTEQGADVLIADLGGGYLDVALVTGLRFVGGRIEATIASYGGYAMGVDRVGARFSGNTVPNAKSLVQRITMTIACHVVDFKTKNNKRPASKIKLALAGGGFRRLGDEWSSDLIVKQINSSLAASKIAITITEVWPIADDTKYLTLKGLKLLHKFPFQSSAVGEKLSALDPLEARERFPSILSAHPENAGDTLGVHLSQVRLDGP